jgi:hypothetical protein
LNYKGLLSPVVENEMTFKIEQEINSDFRRWTWV